MTQIELIFADMIKGWICHWGIWVSKGFWPKTGYRWPGDVL